MDLKDYYRKLRALESRISLKDIYVVSLATQDGGKDGVITQVARRLGCQLVVEGKARLAEDEEVAQFEQEQTEKRSALENEAFARRIQVQVVSDPQVRFSPEIKPVKG